MNRLRSFTFTSFVLVSILTIFPLTVRPQSCNGCTPPASNQQWWAPNTPLNVYVDPGFQTQLTFSEQNVISAAVTDWFQQSALTTNNITLTFVTQDPGYNAHNTIRIMNDPTGSPNTLAFTDARIDLATKQMASATIYFNRGYLIDPDTPAYDPTDAYAPGFIKKIFHHEFGHVFGERDASTSPACSETPNASVMNGYCGPNDEIDGGVSPSDITSCDNFVANLAIAVGGTVRSSLAAEYVLREGCGSTVYDSGPSNLNGTLEGGTWTESGLRLSDSDLADGVLLPDAVLAQDHTSVVGFTIEFWVNLDPESENDYYASFSNSGISLIQYLWNGQSDVIVWINGQTTETLIVDAGSSYWLPNVWKQVVITRSNDGSTVSIYLNGVLNTSQTVSNNVPVGLDVTPVDETVSAGPKVIGATVTNYDNPSITGLIGEMRIYSTSLTAQQVLANYNFRQAAYTF